jgi:ring-1,2-phenylacetyl-CoA epoxidase subunit PaaC
MFNNSLNLFTSNATSPSRNLDNFVLEIADDALILGHRLSEWCGHGPTIEEDIALANISLDHLGHAQCLYQLLVERENSYISSDALAFFRESYQFRNSILVEQENGDFARTIVRQFFVSSYYHFLYQQLSACSIPLLSHFAEKAIKEVSYHLRHANEWLMRLGDGTTESKERSRDAIELLWPFLDELSNPSPTASALIESDNIFDAKLLAEKFNQHIEQSLSDARLTIPSGIKASQLNGRQLHHSEHLSQLLSVMQSTARAHPDATW